MQLQLRVQEGAKRQVGQSGPTTDDPPIAGTIFKIYFVRTQSS
jgi:hypothetical protein